MKKIGLFILYFLITLVCVNAKVVKDKNMHLEADSINGIYIPTDEIDACMELDKMLSDSTKIQIIELGKDFPIRAHHSMGMWIRNNWGLWSGSRLQTYLLRKGLKEPDDMSHHILTFYLHWLEKKNENKN